MLDQHREITRAIQAAPLLSPVASQLLQITAKADHEMKDVIDLVKCDSILTARMLKVVNSAAMGLLHQISSVEHTVSYLGERVVVSIAIAECTAELFTKPLDGYESESGQLWKHELFTAIASRAVANHAKVALPLDMAFTAGLLHDIGKAILSEFLRDTSRSVLTDIVQGNTADYLTAEHCRTGLDHSVVGFELAKHWKLPEILQQVILHHHHPEKAATASRALTYAVHLGDILAMMGGCGTGSDSMQYHLQPDYADYFNISKDELAMLLLESTEEFKKIEASMAAIEER
jgi:putative nucleotidyltransferase with HDIG domain